VYEKLDNYRIFSVNFTLHQTTITRNVHHIGETVVEAYWNFSHNLEVDNQNGPSFWYFGPSPPDETILQEATELASNTTKLLPP